MNVSYEEVKKLAENCSKKNMNIFLGLSFFKGFGLSNLYIKKYISGIIWLILGLVALGGLIASAIIWGTSKETKTVAQCVLGVVLCVVYYVISLIFAGIDAVKAVMGKLTDGQNKKVLTAADKSLLFSYLEGYEAELNKNESEPKNENQ